jgi:hypothetical protein
MDEPAAHPQPLAAEHGRVRAAFPEPGLPVRAPSRRDRLARPLLTAGIIGGLTVALHFRDPHDPGSWGLCPWFALTGQYCPGCGGLRAVNDLTNGDLVGAASSNLVFVVMVPLLVLWWLRWTGRAWTGAGGSAGPAETPARAGRHAGTWIALFVAVTIVFGVLRNLPFGSWLAP